MDLAEAIKILNCALRRRQPAKFTATWTYCHAPKAYRYIRKNVRTELGDIDWDSVTCKLDKQFQRRWMHLQSKKAKTYRNISEVRKVMKK